MIIELLKGDEVYTKIETATPELEFETYQKMLPELTRWRECQASEAELREQIRKRREQLYREQVDPITAQINRLRDMEPRSIEVDYLIAKRTAIVEAIKEGNPYPEEVAQDV